MPRDFQVTFDCVDAQAQAEFWRATLGYRPQGAPEGYSSWEEWLVAMDVPKEEWNDVAKIVDPDGIRPPLCFLRVPEAKTVKNRVHLDLDVADRAAPIEARRKAVDAEVERLHALGARPIFTGEGPNHYHVTMQDPEGNEFCVR